MLSLRIASQNVNRCWDWRRAGGEAAAGHTFELPGGNLFSLVGIPTNRNELSRDNSKVGLGQILDRGEMLIGVGIGGGLEFFWQESIYHPDL